MKVQCLNGSDDVFICPMSHECYGISTCAGGIDWLSFTFELMTCSQDVTHESQQKGTSQLSRNWESQSALSALFYFINVFAWNMPYSRSSDYSLKS